MCCGAEPRPLVNRLGSFGTQVCRRSVSGTGNKSCARRAVGLRDGPAVAADAGGDVTTKALAARREESTISAMCRKMQLTIFFQTPRVSRHNFSFSNQATLAICTPIYIAMPWYRPSSPSTSSNALPCAASHDSSHSPAPALGAVRGHLTCKAPRQRQRQSVVIAERLHSQF